MCMCGYVYKSVCVCLYVSACKDIPRQESVRESIYYYIRTTKKKNTIFFFCFVTIIMFTRRR